MRQETKAALQLVVEKSDRLRDGRYVQTLQQEGGTNLKYTMSRTKDGTMAGAMEHRRPDDDATYAVVTTFRFFILDKEIASFRWLAKHVLDDPDLSDEWKQGFSEVREQLNAFLDQPSIYHERVVAPPPAGSSEPVLVEECMWTHREILDIFINGDIVHAEPKKRAVFVRWRANDLGFPFVKNLFDSIIMGGLHAVAYVGALSERELAAQA